VRRDHAKLRKVNAELVEIVMALCNSFETISDEGSWIVSQVDAVRDSVRDGADRRSLAAASSAATELVPSPGAPLAYV
jgi:hypothetical protein